MVTKNYCFTILKQWRIVLDCETKELQQFNKNAENSNTKKALRPGLLFGQHGRKKEDTVQIL